MGTITDLPIQTVDSTLTASEINQSMNFANDLRNLKTPNQINETVNFSNNIKDNVSDPSLIANAVSNAVIFRGSSLMIEPPHEELRKVPVKIFQKDGRYTTNFNPKDWEPASFDAIFYVSQTSGDNANDGLSAATPFQDIKTAGDAIIAHAGTNFKMVVFDGYFDRLTGWKGFQAGSKNIVVNCIGDVTSSCEFSGLSWANEGSGMWSASRTNTGAIYDKISFDSNGDWTQLEPVDSVSECQSKAGSTYTDGSTIYVHRNDGLQPTESNTMTGTTTINVRPAENGTTIIYNMKMYGGSDAISCNMGSNINSTVILVNCFSGYTQTNAADFNGARRVICYNHTCVGAGNDGFNYQAGVSGVEQLAVEINCTARNFGKFSSDENNNASSIHDDGRIIRVNCDYGNSRGPVVNDVNNSMAWNINCISGGTFDVSGSLSSAWANGLGAISYLLNCDSKKLDDFDASATGSMYLRECATISEIEGNVALY